MLVRIGDYDGDIFCCITEPSLIPPTTHPPMRYTTPPPKPYPLGGNGTGLPVRIHEIKDFFINFIQNDNLGHIAITHLIYADYMSDNA